MPVKPFTVSTTKELKDVISFNYNISKQIFDVVKIGERTYIYVVTKEGYLRKYKIFYGSLPMTHLSTELQNFLQSTIEIALKKYGHFN